MKPKRPSYVFDITALVDLTKEEDIQPEFLASLKKHQNKKDDVVASTDVRRPLCLNSSSNVLAG